MTGIKICGITREAEIDSINRYLPEYVGFVYAKSRRQVVPDIVKGLSRKLDGSISTVGVFANEEMDELIRIVEECGLDVVQIHGDETPGYVLELKRRLYSRRCGCEKKKVEIWKAIRVKDRDSVKIASEYNTDAFVLDAFTDSSYGGAGKTFDWKLALEAKKYGRIILAGGLNLENIREALQLVQPFSVDVSSGVETDGWKDEKKIRDFINAVRCESC